MRNPSITRKKANQISSGVQGARDYLQALWGERWGFAGIQRLRKRLSASFSVWRLCTNWNIRDHLQQYRKCNVRLGCHPRWVSHRRSISLRSTSTSFSRFSNSRNTLGGTQVESREEIVFPTFSLTNSSNILWTRQDILIFAFCAVK